MEHDSSHLAAPSSSRTSGEAAPNAPRVGDRLKDNDPRMAHRGLLTIIEILPNGVYVEDSKRRAFALLRKSIHTDGKPRKGGFALIPRQEAGPWNAHSASGSPARTIDGQMNKKDSP